MPLKRTPPATPTRLDVTNLIQSVESVPELSGSAPNLSNIDQENSIRKRKRDDVSCLSVFMEEIRGLLAESNRENSSKFSTLESKLEELITQNNSIMSTIEFVSQKYDELQIKLDEASNERKADRQYIQQLESKIETLERSMCSTRLELKNVPKKEKEESKEDLCNIIIKTGSVVGVSVQQIDIKDVFRTKSKSDKPGIVVVDLVSAIKRDKIIRKTREYNRNNSSNKLNTQHLSIEGPEKPIYLSECLTPRGHHLYHLARKFANDNAYKYCWTSYGKVYLRRDTNERYTRVDSEEDLSKLRLEK